MRALTNLNPKSFQITAVIPAIKRQIVVSAGVATLPLALSLPAFASSSSTPDATAGLSLLRCSNRLLMV